MIEDYKIIKELGSGMFGTVYLVEKDGIEYALKIEHILEKDLKKDLSSPLWREIEFLNNFTKKYPDQFIQLVEHDIVNKCQHVQKYSAPVDINKEKHLLALSRSPYCSRKIFTLIDDTIDKIDFVGNIYIVYSIICQVLYAVYLMHKNGYVHMDLHLGNIGVKMTDKKFVKIFGRDVPTFGYQIQLLDFGFVLNKKYILTKDEKRLLKLGMDLEILSAFNTLSVEMGKVYEMAPKNYTYEMGLKSFLRTPEYDLMGRFVEEENFRFYLYQIIYPKKFQVSMLGDSFRELLPYWILVRMEDIIFVLRSVKFPKTIIKYFISKL